MPLPDRLLRGDRPAPVLDRVVTLVLRTNVVDPETLQTSEQKRREQRWAALIDVDPNVVRLVAGTRAEHERMYVVRHEAFQYGGPGEAVYQVIDNEITYNVAEVEDPGFARWRRRFQIISCVGGPGS